MAQLRQLRARRLGSKVGQHQCNTKLSRKTRAFLGARKCLLQASKADYSNKVLDMLIVDTCVKP